MKLDLVDKNYLNYYDNFKILSNYFKKNSSTDSSLIINRLKIVQKELKKELNLSNLEFIISGSLSLNQYLEGLSDVDLISYSSDLIDKERIQLELIKSYKRNFNDEINLQYLYHTFDKKSVPYILSEAYSLNLKRNKNLKEKDIILSTELFKLYYHNSTIKSFNKYFKRLEFRGVKIPEKINLVFEDFKNK